MIALALLLLVQTAPTIDGLPLAPLPSQALPAKGCAAFLWTVAPTKAFVAMASAGDGRLRLSLGGTVIDLARTGPVPTDVLGLAGSETYAGVGASAVLDLTIEQRADLTKGAAIPAGTLRVDRPGQDSIIVPVRGLVGCAG